jgi:predicted nucleic acid-binding protein
LSLFVDTSAWSAAFRRDRPDDAPQVHALVRALETGEQVVSTGLVLQELLQGFSGPKARDQIIDRFAALPLIVPDRNDHIDAAGLRNRCRQRGVQVGTIDALFAQLCIHHELTLLTLDEDFQHIAMHCNLRLWKRSG